LCGQFLKGASAIGEGVGRTSSRVFRIWGFCQILLMKVAVYLHMVGIRIGEEVR